MNSYDRGDNVTLTAIVEDADGVAADPTALSLKIRSPDGTTETRGWPNNNVIRTALGHFESDLSVPNHGAYRYRWEASGDVVAASENQLYVRRSLVPAAP